MGTPITEGTNLAVVLETPGSEGADTPPTTPWFHLDPNSYGDVGPSFEKLARMPISKLRQNRRGMLVDMDVAAPFETDLYADIIDHFLESLVMSAAKHSGGTGVSQFRPTSVTDGGASPDEYDVPAGGALQANTLIVARRFKNAANNGLKVVVATSDATNIKVATGTLVAEAVAITEAARVDVAGYRASANGVIQMDANGDLIVVGGGATDDFTLMGLNVGQWIWVGGALGGANAFANQPTYRGFARIKAIAAAKLTLERRSWTVGVADNAAGKQIDLYFGRWARNVAMDHPDMKRPSYAFELTYPDLGAGPVPEYEYLLGCMLNETVIDFPLTSKATANWSFVGMKATNPSTARKTGPSDARGPSTELGLSTATDIARLRVTNTDETGIGTDFQSLKMTIKNNTDPQKLLGTLGASRINVGRFEIAIEASVIFSSDQLITGIRDNRRGRLDIGVRNGDFGALFDVMSIQLDEGDRKFESNKAVTIDAKITGTVDPDLGSTLGISVFPYLPTD
jgi:hypothetical protein